MTSFRGDVWSRYMFGHQTSMMRMFGHRAPNKGEVGSKWGVAKIRVKSPRLRGKIKKGAIGSF